MTRVPCEPREPLHVGSTLWYFDQNQRVYPKDKGSHYSGGSPIWREHWRAVKVESETKRSWVVRMGYRGAGSVVKHPKTAFENGGCPRGWALDQDHITELEWQAVHHYQIAEFMRRHNRELPVATLKKIAEMIGYDATKG